MLVLDGGYSSLPGGSCDGRNPGEIGVDLPCELAPTSKYPRFDLAIGGAGGANLKIRGAHANRSPRLGLDQPRPAHSEVGVDRDSYWRGGGST